jgi:hypothetical protein
MKRAQDHDHPRLTLANCLNGLTNPGLEVALIATNESF